MIGQYHTCCLTGALFDIFMFNTLNISIYVMEYIYKCFVLFIK